MGPYKRIIAGFLAIATLSANIIAASADVSSDPGVKVGWWTAQLHNLAQRSDGLSIKEIPYGSWLCSIAASLSGRVCEFSDDHWHHADESDYVKVSEGKDGTYGVRAKCKYCHKEFAVGGLTADDLSSKYNDYVSNLPASGYTSAGGLLWQPRWIEDMAGEWPYTVKVGTTVIVSAGEDGKPVISDSETVHARIVGSNIIVTMDYQKAITVEFKRLGSSIFYAPVDGTYTQVGTNPFANQGLYIDDTTLETTGGYWKQKTFGHLLPPSRITTDFYNGQSYTSPLSSYTSPKMKYGTILFQTPT